jgi:predicted permease
VVWLALPALLFDSMAHTSLERIWQPALTSRVTVVAVMALMGAAPQAMV